MKIYSYIEVDEKLYKSELNKKVHLSTPKPLQIAEPNDFKIELNNSNSYDGVEATRSIIFDSMDDTKNLINPSTNIGTSNLIIVHDFKVRPQKKAFTLENTVNLAVLKEQSEVPSAASRYNHFTGKRKSELVFGELEQESFDSSDVNMFDNMKQEIQE